MTQFVPRKAIGTTRRFSAAVLTIVTIAATAAVLTSGYALWRFLVSAFLVLTLAVLVALLALVLPDAVGRGEK